MVSKCCNFYNNLLKLNYYQCCVPFKPWRNFNRKVLGVKRGGVDNPLIRFCLVIVREDWESSMGVEVESGSVN